MIGVLVDGFDPSSDFKEGEAENCWKQLRNPKQKLFIKGSI